MALFDPIDKKKKPKLPERTPETVTPEDSAPIQTQPIAMRPLDPLPATPATQTPETNPAAVQQKPAPLFPPIQTSGETPTAPTAPSDEPLPIRPAMMPPLPERPAIQPAPTLLEQRQKEYDAALAAPVQKQGKGKQALFMALQAINNIATGQNKPVEWLGNAKKQYAVDQAARELAPVQQQEQWKQAQEQRKAQIEIAKQKPGIEAAKLDVKRDELDLRKSRNDFLALDSGRKTQLQAIMKRGYYKEGVNPAEDAALAQLGIVLPDFDSRKREVKEQAGQFYERNPDTGEWTPTKGMGADESEVPIKFLIGGKEMMLRPRDVAGIEAAKERQVNQQTFQDEQRQKREEFESREAKYRRDFELIKKRLDAETQAIQTAASEEAKKAAMERKAQIDRELLELRAQYAKDLADYKKLVQ